MKWRFRKSKKILPGIKLNLTSKGLSANIGIKGANIHIGKDGKHLNLGIPGTGISSRTKMGGNAHQHTQTYSYFCPSCDLQVDPSQNFCGGCGSKFLENQPLTPQAQAAFLASQNTYIEPPPFSFWKKALIAICVIGTILFFIWLTLAR
jgi:hypothetical protein